MKSIKFPTPHTILLIIAGLVALLTWFIPAGKYDTLQYDKTSKKFIKTHLETTEKLPGNQETLASLNIKIPLEKVFAFA